MTKVEARKLYLEKRKQYTEEEVQWKSLQITTRFFAQFTLEGVQCVHIFLPIARQNEVDTWPVIQRLTKNYPALQIAIPKADKQTFHLESYLYHSGLKLQTNEWGISEPVNGQFIEPLSIDLIVLPLLAFDERGYRVGYGKGFYDRYLQRCRKEVVKIGVSLEAPIQLIEDVDTYDVRMDACITPERLWKFE